MNLNQSCYAIVSYKIKCDFRNWPICDILRFFFDERIIAETSNFQGMSAKNDSLLQMEEIFRIYANSKYLDRNVPWVIFIFAEYTLNMTFTNKQTILSKNWMHFHATMFFLIGFNRILQFIFYCYLNDIICQNPMLLGIKSKH